MTGEPTGRRLGLDREDVLLAWIALLLVFLYWHFREAPATDVRMSVHARTLAGDNWAPFQYRVLAPLFAEALIRPLRGVVGDRRAFHLAYLIWNALWTTALLLTTRRFFGRWFERPWPLIGALVTGFALAIAFAEQVHAPWSVAEPVLFLIAVELFLAGRGAAVLAVVFVASLNRATAVYIVLAVAALAAPLLGREGVVGRERAVGTERVVGTERAGRHDPWWRLPALAAVVWASVFVGLRLAYGARPPYYTYPELVWLNAGPGQTLWAGTLFVLLLGPLWYWSVRGWSSAPDALRRLGLVVPPIVLLWLVYGRWREVRVLIPAVPILVGLALHHLTARKAGSVR